MKTFKTYKHLYLIILFPAIFFSTEFTFSQYYFEMSYGGIGSELATVLDLTSDGGYVVVGSSSSFSSDQDMYILKLNSNGNVEWSKVYHSPGSIDRLHNVKQNTSGGYYLTGYVESGFGFVDHSILKADGSGNLIWAKNFGGMEAEELRALTLTPDGGILVSGYNASFGAGAKDVQAIKISSSGDIEWAKTYGSIWEDFNFDNKLLSDGNYLLSGATDISGYYSIRPLIIKIDPAGNIIWSKIYSGTVEDWGYSIETDDSGFLLSGDTRTYGLGGSRDIYLIKTDSLGNVLWAKAYGGIGDEESRYVLRSIDNKYVICGFTDSFGFGGFDAFLMKVDSIGNLDWFYTYGGQQNDYARYVLETSDSGYVIAGNRYSNSLGSGDIYLIKTDKFGYSGCDFTAPNVNIFTIPNLQSIDYTLYTHNVISVAGLSLSVTNSNTASKFYCGYIPVELKSFNYKIENNNVVLKWATATEINNHGFEIERRAEEADWVTTGFVEGKGTTAETQYYSYCDDLFGVNSKIVFYRLKQIDYNGQFEYSPEVKVSIPPAVFGLEQNYPNPFNPTTKIRYSLKNDCNVSLSVYDVLGNKVASLVNSYQNAGMYEVIFDGSNLSSRIYFYQIKAGEFTAIKKLLLLK